MPAFSSMYPSSGKFAESVIAETRHQVRRLQHHPSMLMFSGNNELELALRDNWYNTTHKDVPRDQWPNNFANTSQYVADNIELFGHLIKDVVRKNAPNMPWLTSSPSNAIDDEDHGKS